MNNAQTIEKMNEMKLYGMARASASAFEMGIDDIAPVNLPPILLTQNMMTGMKGGLKGYQRLQNLGTEPLCRRSTLIWIEIYLKICF